MLTQENETKSLYPHESKGCHLLHQRLSISLETFTRDKRLDDLRFCYVLNICIHQDHVNIFLNLHHENIVHELKGINYQLFLDIIVKCVVDYEEGKLVLRKVNPGNQCKWNKNQFYCQYSDPFGNDVFPGGGHENLLSERIQFWKKHPYILFHD